MKRRISILIALLLAIGLGVIVFGSVSAQQPTPSDDDVNRVAKQLYCPVCENITLDVCQTTACGQWRDLIREKLAAGWSDQEIKDYFATQYGDRVLPTPPLHGLNWLFYIVPPVVILLGAALVFYIFRNMRARSKVSAPVAETEPTKNDQEDDNYYKRLEEELRRRQ